MSITLTPEATIVATCAACDDTVIRDGEEWATVGTSFQLRFPAVCGMGLEDEPYPHTPSGRRVELRPVGEGWQMWDQPEGGAAFLRAFFQDYDEARAYALERGLTA